MNLKMNSLLVYRNFMLINDFNVYNIKKLEFIEFYFCIIVNINSKWFNKQSHNINSPLKII